MKTLQLIAVTLLILGQTYAQDEPHECVRPCTADDEPRVCEYHFTVEWYLTMSKACYDCPFVASDCYRPHCIPGDGNQRALIAINRQYPAPTIEVCEGDTVRVHVKNDLANGEGTTIHWHGIHQRNTQYMDGTNMVTQCPISEASTFTYEFEASPSGTHIYHAHTGLQMADGLLGVFIVHPNAEDDPAYDEYDHDCNTPHGHCEHVIAIHDWMPETYIERWAKLKHFSFSNALPISSLVNGRMNRYEVHNETDDTQTAFTPYTVIEVEAGKRYRIRLVGEGHMPCGYKFSVDGHNMRVVNMDGRPVQPREVETLAFFSGERYDFILDTSETPGGSGNFWFKAHATNFCRRTRPNAYAILRYAGSPAEEPVEDPDLDRGEGYFLQPILGDANPDDLHYQHGPPWDINVDELTSTTDEDFTDEEVDDTYYLTLSMINNDNSRFHHAEYYPQDGVPESRRSSSSVIDNITFLIPPVPILSQPDDVDPSLLCDRFSVDMPACETDLCLCVHTISFEEDRVVEIIILNDGTNAHPMHMHGYAFRVMGTERIGEGISLEMIQEMNENGELEKKLFNPVYRDTVTVHDRSYVVIRFRTDNPGYWLLHCHISDHLDDGQIILMAIGEHADLPEVPEGFPQCGDWSVIEARLKKQQHKLEQEFLERAEQQEKEREKASAAEEEEAHQWFESHLRYLKDLVMGGEPVMDAAESKSGASAVMLGGCVCVVSSLLWVFGY